MGNQKYSSVVSHNATARPWFRQNDTAERNLKARQAYESLMTVTLRKPTSPEYRKFSQEVKARAATMYKNFTYGEQEVCAPFMSQLVAGLSIVHVTFDLFTFHVTFMSQCAKDLPMIHVRLVPQFCHI